MFRLYGPLASWGEIAVGEVRSTDGRPTRSAIVGLLAAALGLRREQQAEIARLSERVGIAVRVDAPGEPLTDFQTAQWHPRKNAVLSWRQHLCDALYTVAVWAVGPEAHEPLSELEAALDRPVFPLYLGRKACPPAWPLGPSVVEVDSLAEAFASPGLKPPPPIPRPRSPSVDLFFDLEARSPEFLPEQRHLFTRRDRASAHSGRVFANRREGMTSLPTPSEGGAR